MDVFDAWEIEQELEQLKAQMRNPNWAKYSNQAPPNAKYTPLQTIKIKYFTKS
jgi:hypothetical protein